MDPRPVIMSVRSWASHRVCACSCARDTASACA